MKRRPAVGAVESIDPRAVVGSGPIKRSAPGFGRRSNQAIAARLFK